MTEEENLDSAGVGNKDILQELETFCLQELDGTDEIPRNILLAFPQSEPVLLQKLMNFSRLCFIPPLGRE